MKEEMLVEPPPLCSPLNLALLCGTVFVLMLSTAELLSPLVICGLSVWLLQLIRRSKLIDDSLLLTVVYGLIVLSSLLFLALLLQLRNAFSFPALILRNICNVTLTVFAILIFVETSEQKEIDLFTRIIHTWSNAANFRMFEEKYNCVSAQSCSESLKAVIADVFTLGRRLKIPIGIFWAAIVFYGIPAVLIVAFDDKRRAAKAH
jgi:hypothetical protein